MRPRCTATPASPRGSPCTSRGTRSTATPTSRSTPPTTASPSARSTRNTFQDDDYKLGCVTHPDPRSARRRSTTTSSASTSWTRPARATSRSGSPTAPTTRDRTTCAAAGPPRRLAAKIYERIGEGQRLVLEYKFFEPAFYHTDVPDWGTSYAQCAALGDRAVVCLDTGHHAPGTNIEFIVVQLLRARQARLLRLQLALLRRRRPDRRRGRPVPAVPHPLRGRPRRRLRRRQRRRVHARPVPQHRGQDPRPDPLGAQRAGDDGAGAARRPRRPRAARRPATCWRPTAS